MAWDNQHRNAMVVDHQEGLMPSNMLSDVAGTIYHDPLTNV